MSKVFSAKLNKTPFKYELNGAEHEFEYLAPSTMQIDDELSRGDKPDSREIIAFSRKKASERIRALGKLSAEEMIKDQEENGNLYELLGALGALLADEKNAKRRS